jgi:5-methyltetrahydropteroyltriglutamate--homocysteine methyltransferase
VGSLLRPAHLAAARKRWRDGDLPDGELRAIKDACIVELVARQQSIGVGAITDGELRRDWWHLDAALETSWPA